MALVQLVGQPITATSANRSGRPPAQHAQQACLDGVDLVLDDGPRHGQASTVVEILPDGRPRVLRQGAAQLEGLPG